MRPWLLVCCAAVASAQLPRDTGYRGIWYYNQPSGDQYVYKYSGGFATYPQQQSPIAIYAPAVKKTFFVYGGTVEGRQELLHMVAYYDHATGRVPRPAILLNKGTNDAHDNPTLAIDHEGYLWVFSSAHGTARPAYIHRSRKPYSIDGFERVLETNFSYTQPWYIDGRGFLFLHTRYRGSERALYWMTSADGRAWSEPSLLAFALKGHYQISWPHGGRVGTAFDIHPRPAGLNARTNLYYLETADMGQSWRTAAGEAVRVPIEQEHNAALVRDYHTDGRLVYLKDLQYDAAGHPVILYLTSAGYRSGPQPAPRELWTARWSGREWIFRQAMTTDHNYDHGSFTIEKDGAWRLLAPTAPGPQPWGTGGEVELWVSSDQGARWEKRKTLTRGSRYNHTYVRRPLHAQPDFAALWADGDAFRESASRLYFATRDGKVYQLPERMTGAEARPRRVR